MRIISAVAAGLAATLFSSATPNFEIAKTSFSVDKHREKLDNGELIVRVQRTDDLFSDPTAKEEAHLLLHKNSHIALRIHLDSEQGKLNVNDEPLDILSHQPVTVSGIKVETISLPNDHDSPVLDADQMLELVSQLSLGIARIEIKVDSEPLSPSVGLATFRENEEVPSIEALTVRRVGLWVRITEIEGKELAHTTTIFTPILQLVVTSSGNKINKIATLAIDGLAIDGKVPIDDHRAMPGPVMGMSLPPTEGGARRDNGKPHPHPHHHEHEHKPTGMLGWLAAMFGLRGDGHRRGKGYFGALRKGRKPGCMKMAGKGGKVFNKEEQDRLATHRPLHHNPFGDANEVKDHMKRPGLAGMGGAPIHERPHGHPHAHPHPPHRRHGKCGRFLRDLGMGFVHFFAVLGSAFMHPLALIMLGGMAVSSIAFSIARRLKKRSIQLEDEEEEQAPLFDYDKEKDAGLEQVIVFDEDLPKYQSEM